MKSPGHAVFGLVFVGTAIVAVRAGEGLGGDTVVVWAAGLGGMGLASLITLALRIGRR